MKKIISGIMALALVASNTVVISASADTTKTAQKYLVGDLNYDKQLNVADYATMKSVWLNDKDLDEVGVQVIDMDQDGSFDGTDIFLLKKFILGLDRSKSYVTITPSDDDAELDNNFSDYDSDPVIDTSVGINYPVSGNLTLGNGLLITNRDNTQSVMRYDLVTTGFDLELDDKTTTDNSVGVSYDSNKTMYTIRSIMDGVATPDGESTTDNASAILATVSDKSENSIQASAYSDNAQILATQAFYSENGIGATTTYGAPTSATANYYADTNTYRAYTAGMNTFVSSNSKNGLEFPISNLLLHGEFNFKTVNGDTDDGIGHFSGNASDGTEISIPLGECVVTSDTSQSRLLIEGPDMTFDANGDNFTITTTNSDGETNSVKYDIIEDQVAEGSKIKTVVGLGAHDLMTKFRDNKLTFPGYGDSAEMESDGTNYTITVRNEETNTITVVTLVRPSVGGVHYIKSATVYYYSPTSSRVCYATVTGGISKGNISYSGSMTYTSLGGEIAVSEPRITSIEKCAEYTESYTLDTNGNVTYGAEYDRLKTNGTEPTLQSAYVSYNRSDLNTLQLDVTTKNYENDDSYTTLQTIVHKDTGEGSAILTDVANNKIFSTEAADGIVTATAIMGAGTDEEYKQTVSTNMEMFDTSKSVANRVDDNSFGFVYTTTLNGEETVREYGLNINEFVNDKTIIDVNGSDVA
jgi:hypothetical protein